MYQNDAGNYNGSTTTNFEPFSKKEVLIFLFRQQDQRVPPHPFLRYIHG
jgi:hypothetical protein